MYSLPQLEMRLNIWICKKWVLCTYNKLNGWLRCTHHDHHDAEYIYLELTESWGFTRSIFHISKCYLICSVSNLIDLFLGSFLSQTVYYCRKSSTDRLRVSARLVLYCAMQKRTHYTHEHTVFVSSEHVCVCVWLQPIFCALLSDSMSQ